MLVRALLFLFACVAVALARPNVAQPAEVLPSSAPVLASAPLPSPTVTALPPPFSPPPDARGGAHTTPPLGPVSPHPQTSPPAALWLSGSDSFTIAGEVHDGRMFVPVVVDGQRMLFMLDTAGMTAVDTDNSPDKSVDTVQIPSLQIGDVHFSSAPARVLRIKPFSRTYFGVSADGVLGQDLFARFPVAIDYDAATVTIYRDSKTADAARPAAAVELPLQLVRGYPTVAARINGVAGAFVVDSGLGGYVTLGANFTRSHRLLRAGEGLSELRLVQPEGEIRGRTSRMRRFSLGALTFDRPVVGVMNVGTGLPLADVSGVIGADLLRHAFVLLDEPAQTASLVLRGGAPAAQDYDRSGLWLIDRNRSIVVRSVTRGSAADVAGLSEGDTILAIDGKLVGSEDLDSVRSRLAQTSTHSVSLSYRHGRSARRIVLVLRSLL